MNRPIWCPLIQFINDKKTEFLSGFLRFRKRNSVACRTFSLKHVKLLFTDITATRALHTYDQTENMDSVENHLTILFLPTLPSPIPTPRLLASPRSPLLQSTRILVPTSKIQLTTHDFLSKLRWGSYIVTASTILGTGVANYDESWICQIKESSSFVFPLHYSTQSTALETLSSPPHPCSQNSSFSLSSFYLSLCTCYGC